MKTSTVASSITMNMMQRYEYDAENWMRILLLDEWDANLDPDRVKEMSAIISKAAEKFLIIEVRHS